MAGYLGSSNRRNPADAFRAAVAAEVGQMNTTVDGVIVSYDRLNQLASVQPRAQQTIAGKVVEAPVLQQIKVAMPGGGGFGNHFDLKPGDPVVLHVRQRDTDTSQTEGGNSEVTGRRSYDLSDAIAYPGGGEDSKTMTGMPAGGAHWGKTDGKIGFQARADGSSAIVGGPNGSDKLTVSADGKIDLKGENGDSLLQIVKDLATVFRNHTNTGAALDTPFVVAADAIIARIDAIKG